MLSFFHFGPVLGILNGHTFVDGETGENLLPAMCTE